MHELKIKAAHAALSYLDDYAIIGIGTGSTVNYFIDALATIKHRFEACVVSSKATEIRLRNLGIPVIDLNVANELPIYIDGADEVNPWREMIKGGGGALTQEKVLATVAKKFICIVDKSKLVEHLGEFPVAVEVLPLARSFVARELVKLGGDPVYRQGVVTDNGNLILDVYHLERDAFSIATENDINLIPGVVENGIFAKRLADVVLVADEDGVQIIY